MEACDQPDGHAFDPGVCDDSDHAVNPSAGETRNGGGMENTKAIAAEPSRPYDYRRDGLIPRAV
jgi:hypothetical protein